MCAAARALTAQQEQRRRRLVLDVKCASCSRQHATEAVGKRSGMQHEQPTRSAVAEGPAAHPYSASTPLPAASGHPPVVSASERRAVAMLERLHPTDMLHVLEMGWCCGGAHTRPLTRPRRWCRPLPWALRSPPQADHTRTRTSDLSNACVEVASDPHHTSGGMDVKSAELRGSQPCSAHGVLLSNDGYGDSSCQWGPLPQGIRHMGPNRRADWQRPTGPVIAAAATGAAGTAPLTSRLAPAVAYPSGPQAATAREASCPSSSSVPAGSRAAAACPSAEAAVLTHIPIDQNLQYSLYRVQLGSVVGALASMAQDWPPEPLVAGDDDASAAALTAAHELIEGCRAAVQREPIERRQQEGRLALERLTGSAVADLAQLQDRIRQVRGTGMFEVAHRYQQLPVELLKKELFRCQPQLGQGIQDLLAATDGRSGRQLFTVDGVVAVWYYLMTKAEREEEKYEEEEKSGWAARSMAQLGEPGFDGRALLVLRWSALGSFWLSGSPTAEREVLDPCACALLGPLFPLLTTMLAAGSLPEIALAEPRMGQASLQCLSPSMLYDILRYGPTSASCTDAGAPGSSALVCRRFSARHIQHVIDGLQRERERLTLASALAKALSPWHRGAGPRTAEQLAREVALLESVDSAEVQFQGALVDGDVAALATGLLGRSGMVAGGTFSGGDDGGSGDSSRGIGAHAAAGGRALRQQVQQELEEVQGNEGDTRWDRPCRDEVGFAGGPTDLASYWIQAEVSEPGLEVEQEAGMPGHLYDVFWATCSTDASGSELWRGPVKALAEHGLLDVEYGNDVVVQQLLCVLRDAEAVLDQGFGRQVLAEALQEVNCRAQRHLAAMRDWRTLRPGEEVALAERLLLGRGQHEPQHPAAAAEALRPGLLAAHPESWGRLVQLLAAPVQEPAEEKAGAEQAEDAEERGGAAHDVGLRQAARLALLGLAVIVGQEVPLEHVRLSYCTATGMLYCSFLRLQEDGREQAHVFSHAGLLVEWFYFLAAVPSFLAVPPDSQWVRDSQTLRDAEARMPAAPPRGLPPPDPRVQEYMAKLLMHSLERVIVGDAYELCVALAMCMLASPKVPRVAPGPQLPYSTLVGHVAALAVWRCNETASIGSDPWDEKELYPVGLQGSASAAAALPSRSGSCDLDWSAGAASDPDNGDRGACWLSRSAPAAALRPPGMQLTPAIDHMVRSLLSLVGLFSAAPPSSGRAAGAAAPSGPASSPFPFSSSSSSSSSAAAAAAAVLPSCELPSCELLLSSSEHMALALLLLCSLLDPAPPHKLNNGVKSPRRLVFLPRADQQPLAALGGAGAAAADQGQPAPFPPAASAGPPAGGLRLSPVHCALLPLEADPEFRCAFRWQSCRMHSLLGKHRVTANSRLDKGLTQVRAALLEKHLGLVWVQGQGLEGIRRALALAAQVGSEMEAQGMALRVAVTEFCVCDVSGGDKPLPRQALREELQRAVAAAGLAHRLLSEAGVRVAERQSAEGPAAQRQQRYVLSLADECPHRQTQDCWVQAGSCVAALLRALEQRQQPVPGAGGGGGGGGGGLLRDELVVDLVLMQVERQRPDEPVLPLRALHEKWHLKQRMLRGVG